MEGDSHRSSCSVDKLNFNPLPPHGGRRTPANSGSGRIPFQSTPSAWRETALIACPESEALHFNPLPPHGGRLWVLNSEQLDAGNFNPLPPHGGRRQGIRHFRKRRSFQSTPSAWRETRLRPIIFSEDFIFQSTPSAWRETRRRFASKCFPEISIHSLRMEGDQVDIFDPAGH